MQPSHVQRFSKVKVHCAGFWGCLLLFSMANCNLICATCPRHLRRTFDFIAKASLSKETGLQSVSSLIYIRSNEMIFLPCLNPFHSHSYFSCSLPHWSKISPLPRNTAGYPATAINRDLNCRLWLILTVNGK